jgi:putative FmdB family regulatory protein
MPTYRYRCAKCGEEIEVWQSINDDPLGKHPGECRGKLTKVLVPAGIVLKGSGFYRTDNRSKSDGASTDKPADKPDAGSSDSSKGSSTPGSEKTGSKPSEPSGRGSSGSSDKSSGKSSDK